MNLFFLCGRRGVASAPMLELSGRRPRRACVRSVPVVPARIDRAPNLAPDVARSLCELAQWFNYFAGIDGDHLHGVTECCLLLFREARQRNFCQCGPLNIG